MRTGESIETGKHVPVIPVFSPWFAQNTWDLFSPSSYKTVSVQLGLKVPCEVYGLKDLFSPRTCSARLFFKVQFYGFRLMELNAVPRTLSVQMGFSYGLGRVYWTFSVRTFQSAFVQGLILQAIQGNPKIQYALLSGVRALMKSGKVGW